jgi:hypothetical protein
LLAALLLSACRSAAPTEETQGAYEPITVKPIPGTKSFQVTITRRAAERLDIHTARAVASSKDVVVPEGAVLFEPNGEAFLYTSPAPLAFVKQDVEVEHFAGDIAVLKVGPPAGTLVVTLGAAELYGAETGLGGEEEEE